MKVPFPKDVDSEQAQAILDQGLCLEVSDRGETPAIEHFYPPIDCDGAELLNWLLTTAVVEISQTTPTVN